jgi:hypothetical protein
MIFSSTSTHSRHKECAQKYGSLLCKSLSCVVTFKDAAGHCLSQDITTTIRLRILSFKNLFISLRAREGMQKTSKGSG